MTDPKTAHRLTAADYLTIARLLALPVLWILAALRMPVYLGIGIALAGLTDVLDGPVARRTGRTSRFGSQLDSLADVLLMGSSVLWLLMLRPDFVRSNAIPLLVWLCIGVLALAATYLRFGRLGDVHLYSAKTAGFVGYLFLVWLLVTGRDGGWFFAVAVGLAIVAATETLLVALTRDRLDGFVGSILGRFR